MSGLREIIEWVKSEWIFNPENTSNEEFERISEQFEKDNRSALANILRDDTPKFLEFLESRLSRAPAITETDEEIEAPERRAEDLESRIEQVQSGITKGVEDIIGKVSNFIRRLFK